MIGATEIPAVDGLEFIYPDLSVLINGTWAMSPILKGYGQDSFEPFEVEVALWDSNYTGKAVLLQTASNGVSPEKMARQALAAGEAKGYGKPAILLQPSPGTLAGFGQYARDNSDVSFIGRPAIEVSLLFQAYVTAYLKAGVPIKIAVRDDDQNPLQFYWPYSAVVTSAIILTAICIACYIVNIYKFYRHIRITTGITTAKVFFVLDLIANFMRFWWACVNPFYVNEFAFTWTTICTSTHFALSIICTLLLALKWRELLHSTKLKVVLFLSSFRWPFLIIAAIVLLVELISSTLRGLWYSIAKLSLASWSFLIIICWIVVILLYVSGVQILMQIHNAVGRRRNVLQLSQTTIFILASGVFLLLWAVTQMTGLIRTYATQKITIKEIQVINVIQLGTLLVASFLQNWAMPIPVNFASRKTSERTGTGHSTKTRTKSGDDDDGPSNRTDKVGRNYSHVHMVPGSAGPGADVEQGRVDEDDGDDDIELRRVTSSSSDDESSEAGLIPRPSARSGSRKPTTSDSSSDDEDPSSSSSDEV